MSKLTCQICGKKYSHLGSHIAHGHKMLARDYKIEFELPYNTSLISSEVKLKRQEAFELHREKYLKNLFKDGEKYRFKKGRTGQRRISQGERTTFIKRINEVNKNRQPEQCPVCKMVYSHLYNKHKLLKI